MITLEYFIGDFIDYVKKAERVRGCLEGESVRFKFNGVWVVIDKPIDLEEVYAEYSRSIGELYRNQMIKLG